jgi:hypothetical protein
MHTTIRLMILMSRFLSSSIAGMNGGSMDGSIMITLTEFLSDFQVRRKAG